MENVYKPFMTNFITLNSFIEGNVQHRQYQMFIKTAPCTQNLLLLSIEDQILLSKDNQCVRAGALRSWRGP